MPYDASIFSLTWWIGVVLVGIVLSLAASYLRTWIDWGFSSVSRKWADRSERSRKEYEKHVTHLLEHPERHLYVIAEEMRSRFRGNFYYICALVAGFGGVLASSTWVGKVVLGIAALSFLLGFWEIARAGRLEALINRVSLGRSDSKGIEPRDPSRLL
jgi:hypothetical protein